MRTTVTLDDDLAARLKRRAAERGVSFKAVLNEALRQGLAGGAAPQPYRMRPGRLGARPGVDLTKALGLAAELEDAETVRKLDQGR